MMAESQNSTLFAGPNAQPLRIRPSRLFAMHVGTAPNWERTAGYDYFWTIRADPFLAELDARGEIVFASGELRVHRIRNPVPPTTK